MRACGKRPVIPFATRSAFRKATICAMLCVPGACTGTASVHSTMGQTVAHLLDASQTVGAVVAVARDGKPSYVQTFGYRNLQTHARVDGDTRFEIGSISKQFTAATILQLSERQKLSLQSPISAYLPSFTHAKQITLRDLLYQISGLPDYVYMPDFNQHMATERGSIGRIAAYVSRPLDFKPGTKWEYSSTNYYVLGRIVELVSHQSYDSYVRSNLFRAAGMAHSGFLSEETRMADFATPYAQGRPAAPTPESWAAGAGSIVSTAGDLIRWNTALAAGKIVTSAGYLRMTIPARLESGQPTDYGMGISIDSRDGHRRFWHNGATNGSAGIDSVFPSDRLDIVVLENTSGNDPGTIERVVLDTLFPDALAAARRPSKGESPAIRARVVPDIEGILSGTLSADQTSPVFNRFWTGRHKAIAAYFARFGPPQREIYKGTFRNADGAWYRYRVEFARDVRDVDIELDNKTQRILNIGIAPPG